MNQKPLIVTEGKTDILYIKAALKNLYNDYPSLIIKEENKFIFKVSFLKRTKLLKYYLNLALDGADTIMNIYNHFVDAYSSNVSSFFGGDGGYTSTGGGDDSFGGGDGGGTR